VHVVRVKKTGYVDKRGRARDYSSAYLRRTYREAGKVKNETVANLSVLPDHLIDLIDAGLKGQHLVPAGEAVTITRSVPHGHVAAGHAMARKLGLPALLGPAGPQRDLALALVISRAVAPASKLSALAWWDDTTLGADLGVAEASAGDIYAAMDWLAARQDAIEAQLAARHLAPAVNPGRMALFDLSSSWLEGRCCPLAARGYSRDGKKGKLHVAITDDSLTVTRKQAQIDAEAALDGIYVLRTPVPEDQLDAPGVVTAYKNLSRVERDFRSIKTDDLDLRPVFHRLEERVRAHVLICMLASYLTWHLRQAWAPLTFTDQNPPLQDNPVTPARRSAHAQAKASYQHDSAGHPYRSFRGLLEHLATLTRNQVRFAGTTATVPMLAEPTADQRQAFDLIGVPVPLTLK